MCREYLLKSVFAWHIGLRFLKDQTRIENAVRAKKIFVKYIAEEKDIEDFGKIPGSDPVIVVSRLNAFSKRD